MINLKYDKELKEWIEENKERIIEEWMDISKIPAIKGEASPDAPYGADCAKALNACAELFSRHGFRNEIYNKQGYALADYGEGEKTIGLFGHSDVVPVGDDWIYTKPFEPIIIDGTMIGRGVEDNKSGIMASLCVMEILRDKNIPVKSKIQAFIGSEEESGMSDIEAFSKEQKMPEASLILDADFPCSIGEKGIYHFKARSNKKCEDIVDLKGGEAFNIVLDKVCVTIKKTAEIEKELAAKIEGNSSFTMKIEDGYIRLWAKGVAKHASEPEGSLNAAHSAAKVLCECKSLSENDRNLMQNIKKILDCPFGTSMGIAHNDIRFGRLTFVNGMISLKDGQVELSFDTRYGSTLESDVLEEKAKRSFESLGWKVIPVSNIEGFSIDDDSPIPPVLVDIYNRLTGFDKKAIRLGGGTYARHLKNAFSVGTVTMRADREKPFMEMPEGHGGPHQCDEKIDIEGFFDAVRIISHYVINIDECLNG